MILSETTVARDWIAQFDETDKNTAKLILDSLIYVSSEELNAGLNQLIQNFIADHQNEYIALFAVKDVIKDSNYWEDKREKLDLSLSDGIGSEASISYLCRSISKTNKYILNHPDINEMRGKKCRYIFCMNDIVGSGEQTDGFCKWLYNSPTIKSWISLRYIEFIICSYAGTTTGINYLKKNKFIKEILINQYVDYGRSFWTDNERYEIENVCKKYCAFTSRKKYPLGYNKIFSFIYFSYKYPNTSPAILWAPLTKRWVPLSQIRPEFEINFNNLEPTYMSIRKYIDYFKLSESLIFNRLNFEAKKMIIILDLLSWKHYSNKCISEMLIMPITKVNKYIDRLLTMGLIDKNYKITKMGKALIRSAKKRKIIKKELDLKKDFYYPKKLRVPIDSSS